MRNLGLAPQVQCQLSSGNDAGLGVGSSESAVLRLRVPPQQVQAQHFPSLKTSAWIQTLLTLHTVRWVRGGAELALNLARLF